MKFRGWHIWVWEDIMRAKGEPYLLRLTVFKCPLFALMVHWFLASDDECLHDHPSPFASLIVRGGYFEHVPVAQPYSHGDPIKSTWYPAGSFLRRPANWIHRVVLGPGLVKATTVVLMGPKVRHWGFHSRIGWIPFWKYEHSEHC